jgi:hypothetical protein
MSYIHTDVSEDISFKTFQKLMKKTPDNRGMHAMPCLLSGDLDTGSRFLFGGATEPLAEKKYRNFTEYLQLYPEYQCIFIGDNGQGDVRASEMILEDEKYKKYLERIYVHQVQPIHLTYSKHQRTRTKTAEKTCYFSSYIDAAIDAYHHNFIRLSGLRRVAIEAVKDFLDIPTALWQRSPLADRDTRLDELNAALRRVNRVLVITGSRLKDETFPAIPLCPKYARGTAVATPYGLGIVDKYAYSIFIVYISLYLYRLN